MYNDTIKAENRIITAEAIEEILIKIQTEMEKCERQYKLEQMQNEKFADDYQNWTVKNYSYRYSVNINFYDDTDVKFDNYNDFMHIFNNRLHEIKELRISCYCNYDKKTMGSQTEYISQRISLDINENRMDISVSLNSGDEIMNDIYNLIKEKILSAPPKYEGIIKNRAFIKYKIGFAIGFIPSAILLSFLGMLPPIKEIYASSYMVFPIACLFMTFALASLIGVVLLNGLYKNLIPEQLYMGYDYENHKRKYKDDVEKYTHTSEILIGKKIDNLKKRNKIKELNNKYGIYIPIELIVLVVLSILWYNI